MIPTSMVIPKTDLQLVRDPGRSVGCRCINTTPGIPTSPTPVHQAHTRALNVCQSSSAVYARSVEIILVQSDKEAQARDRYSITSSLYP
jgi:hypothetical protein